jgi:Fe-S cluster assembly iron-binding protein IscA
MRLLPVILLAALAGCSPSPPPPAPAPVAPKPVAEVSPAAERVLRQLAADQKLAEPWYVRVALVWRGEPQIEVQLDRTPPGPDDVVTEAGNGLRCVIAREHLTYLRGCRVELVETRQGAGFDVTFPNRDAQDREAAKKWLREEEARRKGSR